jgi:hypothetical protein
MITKKQTDVSRHAPKNGFHADVRQRLDGEIDASWNVGAMVRERTEARP